jgi:SAM-dependent methyltransferase
MSNQGREPPHSAAYFGRERDFWWNQDYLELLASRFQLGNVRSVLDVGAGVGHWGMLLTSVLSPEATVVGIEREPQWVEAASRRAASLGLSSRCRYQGGTAEAIPFEDGSFDLVTCQTVLMHVPDARAVIREMLRTASPGGLIIAAEPNNRATLLTDTAVNIEASVDDRIDLIRFYLTCERGKAASGEGNSSIGDLLPGLFAEEGLVEIESYLSDKASFIVSPYDSEERRALKEELITQAREGMWVWSHGETKRFFLAGGGDEKDFSGLWNRRISELQRDAEAVEEERFHSGGGQILYIVAGRKAAK